jgi:hypothetical protein
MRVLRQYRLEILFTFVISLLCGLPSIIMRVKLDREGKIYAPLAISGITGLTYDETTYYAGYCRDAYDGQWLPGDPLTWEHRNDPPRLGEGPLAYWAGALLGRLVKGVPAGFDLSRFLLPALCFLFTALACRQLGAPGWIAVAASLLAIVAHDQLNLPLQVLASPRSVNIADHLHLYHSQRAIEYMRFPNPSFTWPFCVGALMATHAMISTRKFYYAVVLMLLVAALSYMYVFFWTFVIMAAALYALWAGMTGRGAAAMCILLALVVSGLLSAPLIAQLLAPASYGLTAVNARLAWGGAGISLAMQKYEIALWVIFLILYPKRRPEFPYLLAVAIAPYACVFASHAAGQHVQDWHWIGRCWYIWMCLCLVLAVWAIGETEYQIPLLRRVGGYVRRATVPFAMVLSALVLAYGFNDHIHFGLDMADRYTITRGEAAAFHWLDRYADPGAVVMSASCDTMGMVPVYTHCNVYKPYCLLTPADDQELAMRFCITNALLKVKPAAVDRMLQPVEWTQGRTEGAEWWNIEWMFHNEAGSRVLPERMKPVFATLRKQMPTWDPAEIVTFFQVDYLWFGPMERQVATLNPDGVPWLEKVFSQDDVTLYAVLSDMLVNPDKNAAYLEAETKNAKPARHRPVKVRRTSRRR